MLAHCDIPSETGITCDMMFEASLVKLHIVEGLSIYTSLTCLYTQVPLCNAELNLPICV